MRTRALGKAPLEIGSGPLGRRSTLGCSRDSMRRARRPAPHGESILSGSLLRLPCGGHGGPPHIRKGSGPIESGRGNTPRRPEEHRRRSRLRPLFERALARELGRSRRRRGCSSGRRGGQRSPNSDQWNAKSPDELTSGLGARDPACKQAGFFRKKIPAASYSPTRSPLQYHRLQGA